VSHFLSPAGKQSETAYPDLLASLIDRGEEMNDSDEESFATAQAPPVFLTLASPARPSSRGILSHGRKEYDYGQIIACFNQSFTQPLLLIASEEYDRRSQIFASQYLEYRRSQEFQSLAAASSNVDTAAADTSPSSNDHYSLSEDAMRGGPRQGMFAPPADSNDALLVDTRYFVLSPARSFSHRRDLLR